MNAQPACDPPGQRLIGSGTFKGFAYRQAEKGIPAAGRNNRDGNLTYE
jgi:hypothetical protein